MSQDDALAALPDSGVFAGNPRCEPSVPLGVHYRDRGAGTYPSKSQLAFVTQKAAVLAGHPGAVSSCALLPAATDDQPNPPLAGTRYQGFRRRKATTRR
jgi:hypothetical protein